MRLRTWLNISWDDMMSYDFVAYIPGDLKSDAKIVVREEME